MNNKLSVFIVFGNMNLKFESLISCLKLFQNFNNVTLQLGYSNIKKNNYNWNLFDFCSKEEFEEKIKESDIIISHSGVGVISTALKFNKMALVIPRKKKLNEHTNNHQVDFVNEYKSLNIFYLFENIHDLENLILNKKYLDKPKQNYITNLEPLKKDILNYIKKNI